MIDFVKGEVAYTGVDFIAVDVNGVGYQVYVTNPQRLPERETIFLYTHHIVREDAQLLYGFPTFEERDLFRLLLEVSGIGPKAGLAMLAGGTPYQLMVAIQMEDLQFLTRLPGIGKKTAQRIVLDLKDKLKKLGLEKQIQSQTLQDDPGVTPVSIPGERDVMDALLGLGYNEEETEWAVRTAIMESGLDTLATEEWIKRALQISMRR